MRQGKQEEKCACGGEWVYDKQEAEAATTYRRTRRCSNCCKKQIFMYDPDPKKEGAWLTI